MAEQYFGHSALPDWGPYGICRQDRELIGPIRGRTFLEIGAGSGHSLRYILQRGAKRAYGLDFSSTQIVLASTLNRRGLDRNRLQLFHQPMEQRLNIPRVDTVFGIFSLGWSTNLPGTLRLIHSYLRPGGRFVFSWEHGMFQHVEFERRLIVQSSYFSEVVVKNKWKDQYAIHIQFPTTASWFELLQSAGFTIDRYLEPESHIFDRRSQDSWRHFSKVKALNVPMAVVFQCHR
ncbi:MAG: class I SAM-dependent methyltransferase [Candidatus Kerfeldbacteria bacterium]|nr:class I SAM-dependent methyltransferase [Candidatus Kerfeldbacteria bacterium]